jgi:hypothetical protein
MVYEPKPRKHLAENLPLNFENLLRFSLVSVRVRPFDGKTFLKEVMPV